MRVHAELIIIRKLHELLQKHQGKASIPTTEIESIHKDLQEMIEQERGYSRLYLLQSDKYVEQKD